MKKKFEISVFWFRRDLRLEDNIALHRALSSGRKVLLCYLFEPMLPARGMHQADGQDDRARHGIPSLSRDGDILFDVSRVLSC